MVRIKADELEWMVTQNFTRLGTPVTLTAYGYSRAVAIHRFAEAIWEEENCHVSDEFQGLWDFLWWIAGLIDKFFIILLTVYFNVRVRK